MQIKTIFRFHLTPVRQTNNKCWQILPEEGALFTLKGVYAAAVWFLNGVAAENRITHWPACYTTPGRSYIGSLLNYSQQLRKESAQVPINRGFEKMWHLYTVEFYSAVMMNEICDFPGEMDRTEGHHVK